MNLFEFRELEKLLIPEPELRNPLELIKIQNYLIKYPFFQQLQQYYHANNLVDCAIYLKYSHYNPGDVIFSTSQQSLYFYILLQGNISIYYNNQVIRRYIEGVFEECSLVERRKHDTTAIATEESHVVYIDYQIYSGLFFNIREKKRIAISSFLQIQKAFKGWTKAKLMSMSYFLHEIEVKAGTIIFNIGDIADKIYIIHDGFAIIKTNNLKIYSSGDIIGIEDVIKNRPRESKCISQSHWTLLYIFKHDYLEKSKFFKKKRIFPKTLKNNMDGYHTAYSHIFKHHELSNPHNIPIEKKMGLSIQSFAPENNKPVKLFHMFKEFNVYTARPDSTSSILSQTGNISTKRKTSSSFVLRSKILSSRRKSSISPNKTVKLKSNLLI